MNYGVSILFLNLKNCETKTKTNVNETIVFVLDKKTKRKRNEKKIKTKNETKTKRSKNFTNAATLHFGYEEVGLYFFSMKKSGDDFL